MWLSVSLRRLNHQKFRRMKKLLLLPLYAFLCIACSADDSADIVAGDATANAALMAKSVAAAATKPGGGEKPIISCFGGFAAHTRMDVSGGINNPVINFEADVPSTAPANASYTVIVEVQQLADCEDFNLVTGLPLYFGAASPFTNVAVDTPSIAVLPNQLPVCYKWRIIIEQAYTLTTPCKTFSPWYDAPLF